MNIELRITRHAQERMAKNAISKDMVIQAIQRGSIAKQSAISATRCSSLNLSLAK